MSEERKFELRSENFVSLQGWMVDELDLHGNDLVVYAVIYQFSQERNSWCYASMDYIASWLGASIRTVQRCLDYLMEKKLVCKRVATNEEGRFNIYKAFRKPCTDEDFLNYSSEKGNDKLTSPSGRGSRQNCKGVMTKMQGGHDNLSKDTIYEVKEEVKEEYKESANAPAPQKTSRFSKPSISEIAAYCSEKNISIDPASFYYFYESKGWKVGNAPMKNWKAAIQTWVKRSRNGYGSSYSAKPNSCGHNNPEGFDEL